MTYLVLCSDIYLMIAYPGVENVLMYLAAMNKLKSKLKMGIIFN